MGFRFRKSMKIAPGVRLNLSKKSVGISVGTKGARVSANSSGRKTTTVGIPGTGLYYSKSETTKKNKQANSSSNSYVTEDSSPEKIDLSQMTKEEQHWYFVELHKFTKKSLFFYKTFFMIISIPLILLSLLLLLITPVALIGVILSIIIFAVSIKYNAIYKTCFSDAK